MRRDWVNSLLMALLVGLTPNLVSIVAAAPDLKESMAGKCWVIFFLATGATLASPFVLGWRTPARTSVSAQRLYPWWLVLAGICGSAYFLAVLGTGGMTGLGAGVGEALDSSLAPALYATWAISRGTATWSRLNVSGVLAVFVGLLTIGAAQMTANVSGSESRQGLDAGIIALGVVGAAGTACSLWLLRKLVRPAQVGGKGDAALGFAVACRYGGVAIAFLVVALWLRTSGDGETARAFPSMWASVATLVGGAVLVGGAFSAAIKINSDRALVSGMALTPLFALGIEYGLKDITESTAPFGSGLLWLGVGATALGIVALQGDASTRVA